MVTLTPSSDVGKLPPVRSSPVHERVVVERLLPLIVTQEFGATVAWKLAPFITPVSLLIVGTFVEVAAAGES